MPNLKPFREVREDDPINLRYYDGAIQSQKHIAASEAVPELVEVTQLKAKVRDLENDLYMAKETIGKYEKLVALIISECTNIKF